MTDLDPLYILVLEPQFIGKTFSSKLSGAIHMYM